MDIYPGLDQTLHGLMRRYRERVPDVAIEIVVPRKQEPTGC